MIYQEVEVLQRERSTWKVKGGCLGSEISWVSSPLWAWRKGPKLDIVLSALLNSVILFGATEKSNEFSFPFSCALW